MSTVKPKSRLVKLRKWREPTRLHGRISKRAASYFTEMMRWRSRARE